MPDILSLALANLTTPAVMFFGLGLFAGLARSDLSIPEAVAKGLSLYLLISIGFKGGAAAAREGAADAFLSALALGLILSIVVPVLAFAMLRAFAPKLERVTVAGAAAHYGSISIVTFVAAMDFARLAGLSPGGYWPAVAAAMETPGIIVALLLAGVRPAAPHGPPGGAGFSGELLREVLLNGSIVALVGSFAIGVISGERGLARLDIFVNGLFAGALCLFLLEMGLVAARRLQGGARLSPGVVAAGVLIPLASAAIALGLARLGGLAPADGAILMTLAASASYIAAPAAIRIALPEADPGLYLPLSIGVTFPFNIAIGIPLYAALATATL